MAILKCKNCGGNLELTADRTLGTCESCGSTMTLPKIDDEQRAAAFNRGNHFRRIGEFDKALAVYERIVQEDDTDAEAHWCCALSRFGIEYVEDPTTYEWLPTCHRASFDSFLEDVDYKAALEYSEGRPHRQYVRDGAKIAEVQRGILAASRKTEPYDVFICYKESDERGERTRDSLLAQDIYYQLTEQGRRVFFSRITLEDVAGTQYEPYIFAALNSAKVMIVVGTKAEHLNAVWVKNEWSRFLALMRKDHSRVLLPCYRDMDPYDLPEALSVLQSYDMSKIGFLQDLTRGIAKVLDADKKPAPAKETVVVQQAGGTNANALVKRGYMTLEDGQYDKADGFFEEALNHDAECAEAYVGKFLAQKRCDSLDKWIEVRRGTWLHADRKIESIRRNTQAERKLIEANCLPGYDHAERADMQRILDNFKLTYDTCADFYHLKRQELENTFEKDPNLSRGFRFAKGDYLVALNRKREEMFAQLNSLLKKAEAETSKKKAQLEADYADHLRHAEIQFQAMRTKAEHVRYARYAELCEEQERAVSPFDFARIGTQFQMLFGYKDAAQRAQQCHSRSDALRAEQRRIEEARRAEQRRIEEARRAEQKRIEEERQAERRRIQAEQERELAKKKTRNRVIAFVVFTLAAVGIAFAVISGIRATEAQRSSAYDAAESMYLAGDLDGAAAAFAELKNYRDAADRRMQILYESAEKMYLAGALDSALAAFAELGDYEDAADRCMQIRYESAQALLDSGSYREAISAFRELGDYQDSKARMLDAWGWIAQRKTVDCGNQYVAAVKADGTVITAVSDNWGDYMDEGQLDTSGWTDIVAVACGSKHTVGLRADGTVVAVGYNAHGQCDVSEWTDIVAIDASTARTVGLRADGTVVVASNEYWKDDTSEWTDIVAIRQGADHLFGIRADGTPVLSRSSSFEVSIDAAWENLKQIDIGDGIYPLVVGLRQDGTVYIEDSFGDDADAETVGSWSDIIKVCTSVRFTAALRSNGTVVYADHLDLFGSPDFFGWTDVVDIVMFGDSVIGLRSDGTLLTMYFSEEKAAELGQWTDIKVPRQ